MRKAVKEFAARMEQRLLNHDREKGCRGWQEKSTEHLLRKLHESVWVLYSTTLLPPLTIPPLTAHEEYVNIANEAADLANFAMMLADNCVGKQ